MQEDELQVIQDTEDTEDTEELGTEEYLEQLGLPELDGQVTVEIVVEKSPEEEEETVSEAETSEAEGADSTDNEELSDDGDDETSEEEEEEETVSETETSEAEGADSTDNEELSDDGDDETSEDEEEETAERSKITVQLNTSAAPVTTANFTDLVEQNFYDALAFHRLVDGFVAQVGDPASRDTTILEELRELGSGQYIDPATNAPRTIPLEIKSADGEIIYNQIVDDSVELSHEQGVIAMARRNSPLDSASSQFYFTLEDRNDLDRRYAVFGEVSDGLDNVLGIEAGDRIVLARVVEGNISSRESEIVSDSDLLNDWANLDNKVKVDYVLSMQEDAEDDENVDTSDNGTEVLPILENPLLSSQLDTPPEPSENDDENLESENEQGEEEEEEDDEIASAIDEEEEEEETTEETENDDNESILDIDVVDSSFTTELGTEGDDVIDVLEITDADPDSSFAIMGLAGDDEISGGNANDLLSGNKGDDTVNGGDGSDFVRGGKGDDNLIGGAADDFLLGDHGADILTGGAGADSFILRTDVVEMDEIAAIDQANRITDFNVADSDRIIIIAEFIPSEGLDYELVDGDVEIILRESGFILGVVAETSIEDVQNNILAVSPDDYALRFG